MTVQGVAVSFTPAQREDLSSIVERLNDVASSHINASALNNHLSIRNISTTLDTVTLTGAGWSSLGFEFPDGETEYTIKKTRSVYYESHTSVPEHSTVEENPVAGDIWIKTTTSDNGVNYIVKRYSNGTFSNVNAPFYAFDHNALRAYGSNIASGTLYVEYGEHGTDRTYSNEHRIKTWNGVQSTPTVLKTNPTATDHNVVVNNITSMALTSAYFTDDGIADGENLRISEA